MVLLKWKQTGTTTPVGAETAGDGSVKVVKKKRDNERLRSVLHETTYSAGLETLKNNDRFRLPPGSDGNPRWLALLLDAADIGGLSEKTKNDEAKGSLVQLITSNHIEAIVTEEMLENEWFVIVPTKDTVLRMGEFGLLLKAPYRWVVCADNGDGLDFRNNIGAASLAQVSAVYEGKSLPEVIENQEDYGVVGAETGGVQVWGNITGEMAVFSETEHSPIPEDREVQTWGGAGEVTQVEDALFDSAAIAETAEIEEIPPSFPELSFGHNTVTLDFDEDEHFTNLEVSENEIYDAYQDEDNFSDNENSESGEEENYGDVQEIPMLETKSNTQTDVEESGEVNLKKDNYQKYVIENEDKTFTEKEVRDSVQRRFLSDGLEFKVDLAEFEGLFHRENPPKVTFSELSSNTGSEWLNGQVAILAATINADLAGIYQKHDEELRQIFSTLVAKHSEETIKKLSLETAGTRFSDLNKAVTSGYEIDKQNSRGVVVSEKQKIEKDFEAEAENAAEAAALLAKKRYIEVHSAEKNDRIAAVDKQVQDGIETTYLKARQAILDTRKTEGYLLFEQGKTKIIELLSELREKQSAKESTFLQEGSKRIMEMVDNNRKADIYRVETLAEDLAVRNRVAEEQQAFEQRLAVIKAENQERIAGLKITLQTLQDDLEQEINLNDLRWQKKVDREKENTNESDARAESLQKQLKELSESIHLQYQGRLDSLQQSRDNAVQDLVVSDTKTRRIHRAITVMVILLGVSALAIGGIVGWVLGHSSNIQTVENMIEEVGE